MSGPVPWRSAATAYARAAAVLAPLFLPLVAVLLLARLGWVEIDHRIAYERTLVANLLLYWLLAAAAIATLVRRRAVAAFVRQRRAPLLLMTATLAVSLLLAELALRRLPATAAGAPFRTEPSQSLHHRNPPSADRRGMAGERVRTNEDGFRSPHGREEFRRYPVRVALLGDSFLFGLGVDEGRTCADVLERELRRRLGERQAAVLNTGAISYSPLLERSLFRRAVRPYAPTLTVLLLDVNDIGDDLQYEREARPGEDGLPLFDVPERPPGPSWCERSALCRLAGPLRWRLGLPFEILGSFLPPRPGDYDYYRFEIEISGVEETNRFFILRHPLAVTRPHFERTLGHVRGIAAEARASGSAFLLVVAPRYFHWNDRECPDNWEVRQHRRYRVDEPYETEYFRFFEEVRDEAGFPILSLLPAFERAGDGPFVFADDPHWNEAGHRLVGRALAEHLVAQGLVP